MFMRTRYPEALCAKLVEEMHFEIWHEYAHNVSKSFFLPISMRVDHQYSKNLKIRLCNFKI
jgi:hypothetical protein